MIKNGVSDIGVQSEALDRTLDKLIDIARNGYQKEIEGIAQLTAKDKLDRLLFLGQKYPDLKSIGEYSAIARKSEMLDKNLTAARQLVNGNIREYNTAINNFPGTIVASMFGFKEPGSYKIILNESISQTANMDAFICLTGTGEKYELQKVWCRKC